MTYSEIPSDVDFNDIEVEKAVKSLMKTHEWNFATAAYAYHRLLRQRESEWPIDLRGIPPMADRPLDHQMYPQYFQ